MWQFLAGIALALLVTYALRPKPQSQPPAGIEDLKVPTAEEGKSIPVVFGCVRVKNPNVVWYGDYKTQAIKSKGGKK